MARLSTGGESGPLQPRTLSRASLSASILPGITLSDGSGRLRAAAQGSLALPREVEQWPLTMLREKLVKIGARIVRHGRHVAFQFAEVAAPRSLFAEILCRIAL